MRPAVWFSLVFALTLVMGCSNEPRRYKVSGTVLFDGKPLPKGDILFVPDERAFGPDPGVVTEGKFEFMAKGGDHRVEVHASRINPSSSIRGAGGEPIAEEFVPERYNSKSTLRATVKPDGENTFTFELRSDQAGK